MRFWDFWDTHFVAGRGWLVGALLIAFLGTWSALIVSFVVRVSWGLAVLGETVMVEGLWCWFVASLNVQTMHRYHSQAWQDYQRRKHD